MSEKLIAGERLRAQAARRTLDEVRAPWLYTLEVENAGRCQYIVPTSYVRSKARQRLKVIESIGTLTADGQEVEASFAPAAPKPWRQSNE